jgi:tripartite-type tricarboxylate transporter receptor subunit TctC
MKKSTAGSRRNLASLIVAGALLSAAVHTAIAADARYPDRPIRFIVPSAAGGSPDTITRSIANQLTLQMGQQVVVDNRPGGSYTIGTSLIASAPPDGYTMGYANLTSLTVNRFYLDRPAPYDVDRDLAPVIQTHYQPNVLVVTPALPVDSVAALVQYAKAHPGGLLYGSGGNGTSSHIAAELFKFMTGTDIGHVPYKGSPQAITDLASGQIQLTFNNLVTLVPHIKSHRVHALALTGPQRSPLFPQLPTMEESGVRGYEFTVWGGIVVPAATPRALIERLNAEINKAFELPAIRHQFDGLGNTLVGGTPAEFERHIQKENAKWAPIVKRIKLKVS